MFFWPDSNSSRIIFARHSSFLLFINYTLPFRLLLMYCQHQLPPSMRLRWGDVQIHSLCCCIRPKCFAYPLRKLAQASDFGQRWMSKWPTEPKPTTTQHFVTFWMRVESQLVHRINWHSKKTTISLDLYRFMRHHHLKIKSYDAVSVQWQKQKI